MPSPPWNQLHNILQSHPFHKKVLLTESFAQGHQWLEQMGRMHGAVLNLHVQTPQALILRQAQLTLMEEGLIYTPQTETFWILHALMQELATEADNAYIPVSMLTPGVVHCFQSAISELRHAKVRAFQLDVHHFESMDKGIYVKKLLAKYESYLHENERVDDAELGRYVQPDPLIDTIYIMDGHVQVTAAQQEALSTISHERLHVLKSEKTLHPQRSCLPLADASFFHALGPVAEVREVFRRMAEQNASWDEVEVIVSDYATYASIIHAESSNLSVACTYSKGLPMLFSQAGQAATLYLDWLESGYSLEPIMQAFKQGAIRLSSEDHTLPISNSTLIAVLEKSGIGWGRERYGLLHSWRDHAKEESDRTAAGSLLAFFDGLFEVLPSDKEAWTPRDVLNGWIRFLDAAPSRLEQDRQVKANMQQAKQILQKVPTTYMDRKSAIRFGRDYVDKVKVSAEGIPTEGKVHVSSLEDGGHSGRRYTYLVGMNEENWAVAQRQDPILLDEERERISPYLMTSREKAGKRESARVRLLGMIQGTCTLSFLSYRVADHKESNPAFELLRVFREAHSIPDATYENLLEELGPPVGLIHTSNRVALDAQEVWMKQLITSNGHFHHGRSEVLAAYAHLADGEKALEARENILVGEYDGVLATHSDSPISDATSVSKLEMYARCPLQYFYHQVLRVRPKEMATFDRSRWLNAAQRGTLLHAIFQKYWTETMEQGGTHDYERLRQITVEEMEKIQQQVSAPSIHVRQKEWEEIKSDVDIFWEGEKKRQTTPRYMELALHRQDELFQVELGDEWVLPLKGFVDRVDEVAPGQYKIVDYKTGNPRKYKEHEYFSQGTQLQHAIYAIAVEQWLQKTGTDANARVVESSYYFPTVQGQGQEVVRTQNRREETARLVSLLTESMRKGIFPPTKDTGACSYCQYQKACGNQAEFMKDKRNEPTNQQRLSPYMEVEDYV